VDRRNLRLVDQGVHGADAGEGGTVAAEAGGESGEGVLGPLGGAQEVVPGATAGWVRRRELEGIEEGTGLRKEAGVLRATGEEGRARVGEPLHEVQGGDDF